jgi:superfamily II DNA/RNA helicase
LSEIADISKKIEKSATLHRSMLDIDKRKVMDGFKEGHYKTIVTTTAGVRRLTLPDIRLAIQVRVPANERELLERVAWLAHGGVSMIVLTLNRR